MTTIGLIRHGVTDWNELRKAQGNSDVPLNKTGEKQAKRIGIRLAQEANWDLIITSDLSRAIKTGKIIQKKINLPIHFDERIREIDCGEIEGTTEEERVEKWGNKWRQLDLGMEKHSVVSQRGIAFLEEIVRTYNGKRILMISHGALIGLTLQQLLPEKFSTTYIDNSSITILTNKKGVWDCSLYNCTKHLN